MIFIQKEASRASYFLFKIVKSVSNIVSNVVTNVVINIITNI
jgi:hypothetical protein